MSGLTILAYIGAFHPTAPASERSMGTQTSQGDKASSLAQGPPPKEESPERLSSAVELDEVSAHLITTLRDRETWQSSVEELKRLNVSLVQQERVVTDVVGVDKEYADRQEAMRDLEVSALSVLHGLRKELRQLEERSGDLGNQKEAFDRAFEQLKEEYSKTREAALGQVTQLIGAWESYFTFRSTTQEHGTEVQATAKKLEALSRRGEDLYAVWLTIWTEADQLHRELDGLKPPFVEVKTALSHDWVNRASTQFANERWGNKASTQYANEVGESQTRVREKLGAFEAAGKVEVALLAFLNDLNSAEKAARGALGRVFGEELRIEVRGISLTVTPLELDQAIGKDWAKGDEGRERVEMALNLLAPKVAAALQKATMDPKQLEARLKEEAEESQILLETDEEKKKEYEKKKAERETSPRETIVGGKTAEQIRSLPEEEQRELKELAEQLVREQIAVMGQLKTDRRLTNVIQTATVFASVAGTVGGLVRLVASAGADVTAYASLCKNLYELVKTFKEAARGLEERGTRLVDALQNMDSAVRDFDKRFVVSTAQLVHATRQGEPCEAIIPGLATLEAALHTACGGLREVQQARRLHGSKSAVLLQDVGESKRAIDELMVANSAIAADVDSVEREGPTKLDELGVEREQLETLRQHLQKEEKALDDALNAAEKLFKAMDTHLDLQVRAMRMLDRVEAYRKAVAGAANGLGGATKAAQTAQSGHAVATQGDEALHESQSGDFLPRYQANTLGVINGAFGGCQSAAEQLAEALSAVV